MADNNNDPVLELTTSEPDRKFIRVDQEKYFLRYLDELSVEEQRALKLYGARLKAYMDVSNNKEAADVDGRASLDAMFARVVINSGPIIGKLTDVQKLKALEVFFGLAGLLPPETPKSTN